MRMSLTGTPGIITSSVPSNRVAELCGRMGQVLDKTGAARLRSTTCAAPVTIMPSTVVGTAGAGAAGLSAGARSLAAIDGLTIGTTPDAAWAAGAAESARAA